MIKKTISYTDLDGIEVTEDVYFNMTKDDLLDNILLKDEIMSMQTRFESLKDSDDDDAKLEAGLLVRELLKKFVQIGYGVREGRAFIKDEQTWRQFRYSPAYEAFMWPMYQDGTEALKFINGLMPADLKKLAEEKAAQGRLPLEGVVQNPTPAPSGLTLEEIQRMLSEKQAETDGNTE